MTNRLTTYRLFVFGGVVALAALTGCRDRGPAPGGATSRKARESRDLAQQMAADAVKGAAEVQVAAHPEHDQRHGLVKVSVWVWKKSHEVVAGRNGGATVPVGTTARPVQPEPPARPAAPSEPDPPEGVVIGPAEPKPSTGSVVFERVKSDLPRQSEALAVEDALEQAAIRIEQKLKELDPPVEYRPSAGTVRNDYLRRDIKPVIRDPNERERAALADSRLGTDLKYAEVTVEVTADQVRELRTRGRVGVALRLLGVVAGVSLAGFLFLRLDEWSKGYLTSWLAFAAVALAGGVAAALVLV